MGAGGGRRDMSLDIDPMLLHIKTSPKGTFIL